MLILTYSIYVCFTIDCNSFDSKTFACSHNLKIMERKVPDLILFIISINLLAFYHECCPLIGYATHVLFCDR